MLELGPGVSEPATPPERDGLDGLDTEPSYVVSVSDVHGFLDATRSALTAVGDHPDFEPVVTADGEGRLHWAGGTDYVLVFNGDLIDRGPDSEGALRMAERLVAEAPPGHVRITLGNHEWGALFPDLVDWGRWYSGQRDESDRAALCGAIEHGHLVAAYDGFSFTYAHAGQPSRYDPARLNDRLVQAAVDLSAALGTDEDARTQESLVEEYRRVLGMGRQGGRGFGAGIAWLDFRFLPGNSPRQVVGHTRQGEPVQKGNVVCQNVIRSNLDDDGGEGVLVESADRLRALTRTADGGVDTTELDVPTE